MKINRQDIRAALRGFLELLESTDKQASIELLELWLGQLVFLQHFVGEIEAEADDSAYKPTRDYTYWKRLIAEQFTSLGYYNIPPTAPLPTSVSELVGDAVDDLADIALDISECLQRWENLGEENALWYFRFSYETHWGTHLRNLEIYLHSLHYNGNNNRARQ